MRFTEIASRLTGFSTPIFGVSWNPPQPDVTVASKVLTFLEDRRVLYDPTEVEMAEHCVMSILEIRQFFTQTLIESNDNDDLANHLRAMRTACRKFLSMMRLQDTSGESLLHRDRFYNHGFNDWMLNQALGELRGVFDIHIAQLAVKYGLDIEEQFATVLPAEPNDSSE